MGETDGGETRSTTQREGNPVTWAIVRKPSGAALLPAMTPALIIMALADTLRHCPADMQGWSEVLDIYRSMVVGLLRLQHPCGLWRIVPENEEAHLETSGAIMIATGLTVGIAEGYINRTTAANVLRTWYEVLTWITPDGRLMGCQTPAGAGGWETHKRSVIGERTYGTGSLLRLAAEMHKGGLI